MKQLPILALVLAAIVCPVPRASAFARAPKRAPVEASPSPSPAVRGKKSRTEEVAVTPTPTLAPEPGKKPHRGLFSRRPKPTPTPEVAPSATPRKKRRAAEETPTPRPEEAPTPTPRRGALSRPTPTPEATPTPRKKRSEATPTPPPEETPAPTPKKRTTSRSIPTPEEMPESTEPVKPKITVPHMGRTADRPTPTPFDPAAVKRASEQETAKFREVRAKALEESGLKDLQEKSDSAEPGPAQKKATQQYYEALYNKMRKLDPSLKERIDRTEAAAMRRLERE